MREGHQFGGALMGLKYLFGTKRPCVRTRHPDRWYGECGCPVSASGVVGVLAYGGLDGWDTS